MAEALDPISMAFRTTNKHYTTKPSLVFTDLKAYFTKKFTDHDISCTITFERLPSEIQSNICGLYWSRYNPEDNNVDKYIIMLIAYIKDTSYVLDVYDRVGLLVNSFLKQENFTINKRDYAYIKTAEDDLILVNDNGNVAIECVFEVCVPKYDTLSS